LDETPRQRCCCATSARRLLLLDDYCGCSTPPRRLRKAVLWMCSLL